MERLGWKRRQPLLETLMARGVRAFEIGEPEQSASHGLPLFRSTGMDVPAQPVKP